MASTRKSDTIPPLHIACCQGRPSDVKRLLRKCTASALTAEWQNNTPLMLAVMQNNVQCTKLLLKDKRVNVNRVSGQGCVALSYAVLFENHEVLLLLLARDDIDVNVNYFYDMDGNSGRASPITCAITKGSDFAFDHLLRHPKIDLNAVVLGNSTLTFALGQPATQSIIARIVARPEVDVNYVDTVSGRTAMHWAIYTGHLGGVKALLARADLDVNRRMEPSTEGEGTDGETPLIDAIIRDDNFGIFVALLADRRIDVNAKNNLGETAIDFAMGYHKTPAYATTLLRRLDLRLNTSHGNTVPLMSATLSARPDCVKLILRRCECQIDPPIRVFTDCATAIFHKQVGEWNEDDKGDKERIRARNEVKRLIDAKMGEWKTALLWKENVIQFVPNGGKTRARIDYRD